jgi:hypothetical protein
LTPDGRTTGPVGQEVYRLGYNLAEHPARRMLHTIRRRIRTAGPASAVRLSAQYLAGRALYGAVHHQRSFTVAGSPLPYLFSPNHTERAVEVPWARSVLGRFPLTSRILEVGNVLNRYTPFPHVVLDRYEVEPGVINEDVTQFNPPDRFEVILSISTLEHVGFDEGERSPGKFVRALVHLREACLRPGGFLAITVPLGYNPEVDDWLHSGTEGLGESHILERYSSLNLWREAIPGSLNHQSGEAPFDRSYPGAARVLLWSYQSGASPP